MNKNIFLTVITAIILFSIIWIVLTPQLFPITNANADIIAIHKGFQPPGFTLQTTTGEAVSLSDYQDHPVLVFFWASWCSVCKRTMPGLQSVYEDFGPEGFEILAINTTYQDTFSNAENYFTSQGYSYTMLLDQNGSLSQVYQLHAVPLSVLIGPEGIIVDVIIGSGMNEGYLRAYLNDLFMERD